MLPQDSEYRNWDSVERLVIKIANKVYARVQSAGLVTRISREDLVQEGALIWIKAIEGFDPDYGVQFPTYLWNALQSSLHRYVTKHGNIKHGQTRYHDTINDDEMPIELQNTNEALDPEAVLMQEDLVAEKFGNLSPISQMVASWLITPPDWLQEEIAANEAYSKEMLRRQYRMRAPMVQDLPIIMRLLKTVWGFSGSKCRQITSEVRGVMR